MQKKYLEAGKIVSTHGIRGEVRVEPWCDSVKTLAGLRRLYFGNDGTGEISVKSARPHGGICIIKLDGVDTPEDGARLRNTMLYADRDDFRLPAGTYFIADLIGLEVVDKTSGRIYGKVTDVSPTGANDVYTVKTPEGGEVLIPAIPQVIDETDISGGRLVITPLEGLFDED